MAKPNTSNIQIWVQIPYRIKLRYFNWLKVKFFIDLNYTYYICLQCSKIMYTSLKRLTFSILIYPLKYLFRVNGYKLIGRLVVFHTKCVGSNPTSHNNIYLGILYIYIKYTKYSYQLNGKAKYYGYFDTSSNPVQDQIKIVFD